VRLAANPQKELGSNKVQESLLTGCGGVFPSLFATGSLFRIELRLGLLLHEFHQTLSKSYVPLPGGTEIGYSATGITGWRHPDWLGSIRFVSTPARGMSFDTAYARFGEIYANTSSAPGEFTGAVVSTHTPLYDFLFREQNYNQGRWLTPDPAGMAAVDATNPQSWKRYSYVMNDPLALVDPLGLRWNLVCRDVGDGGTQCVEVWEPDPPVTSDRPDRGGDPGGTGGGHGSKEAANNCMMPSKVQSAVIPVAATAAKFWKKTVLWGLGGSGGAGFGKGFGMYGSVSVQIAVSPNGNAAYVITFAAPASVTGAGTYMWLTPSTKGGGIVGGAQFGFSNATDPSQLKGPGIDASGSLAAGLGIGADLSVSLGGNFPSTFNVTLGFGAGGHGSAGAKTNTVVLPICHN